MQAGGVNDAIQYEADDSCPPLVALSVGLQGVMLAVAPLVLVVAITSKAGGQDDSYLSWAVFAALIIAGVLTALQATRIGRLGAGHILIMGATPNFVAVSMRRRSRRPQWLGSGASSSRAAKTSPSCWGSRPATGMSCRECFP